MRFSAEEKFKVREIKKKDVTAEEFFRIAFDLEAVSISASCPDR